MSGQRHAEIELALREALADYENGIEDDGTFDEYGDPVPGWVSLARLALAQSEVAQ
ncbi:MAG: hypothetical protein AAGH60_15575 [Pseudomonadota bacterium]